MRKTVLFGIGLLCLAVVPVPAEAEASEELAKELKGHVEKLVEKDNVAAKRAALLTWGEIGGEEDYESLAEYKTSDKFSVRLAAGMALYTAGAPDAESFLIDQLTGESDIYPILRDQISVLPDETERDLIETLFEKGEARHKRAAFRYLSRQHGLLYELLGEYATAEDERMRKFAIQALRNSAREQAIEIAESELLASGDAKLQQAGLDLVIEISQLPGRTQRTLESLEGAVEHNNGKIAQRASIRLLEMHDKSGVERLIKLLEDVEKAPRRVEIAEELLAHNVAVPAKRVRQVRKKVDHEKLDQKLFELLVASGDDKAFDKVVEMFGTTHFDKRLSAAKAMGHVDNDKSLNMLSKALFEGNPDMRLAAARSLRQIADPAALGDLKKSVSQERITRVKTEVIRALGAIGSEDALQILRFNSRTRLPKIKKAIIAAVRDADKKEGAKVLTMFFGSRDLQIQWQAFVAALDVAPEEAMKRVDQAFRNPPDNFMADLETLPTDRQKRILEVLLTHDNDRVRNTAFRSARRIGEPFHELFRKIVVKAGTPESTRIGIVRALGAERQKSDMNLLAKIVRGVGEGSAKLRRLAAWTLTDYGSKGLEANFRGYLVGDDTTLSAIGAYGLARIES